MGSQGNVKSSEARAISDNGPTPPPRLWAGHEALGRCAPYDGERQKIAADRDNWVSRLRVAPDDTTTNENGASQSGLVRKYRGATEATSSLAAFGITVFGFMAFGYFVWLLLTLPGAAGVPGADMVIYRDAVERVLAGGSWFLPEQTTGQAYELILGDVMYPPIAAPLMAVALLPWPVWYAVPLGILVACVVYQRPSPWGWAAIAALLAYPATPQLIVSGNPAIWIAAFAALGSVWRPAFAFVLLKPSLFVFALPGARHRGWWAIVGALTAAALVVLPWTLDWVGVILNQRGSYAGMTTFTRDIALMLVPMVAWLTRSRRSEPKLERATPTPASP